MSYLFLSCTEKNFNDYNIKHIENNSMFTGTDAEREKMSLTIGALNQDVMQALTNLFVE